MAGMNGDALDARRQRILASQLKSMGYDIAEVDRAVALGAEAVATLRAVPPPTASGELLGTPDVPPPAPPPPAGTMALQSQTATSPEIKLGWLASLAAPDTQDGSAPDANGGQQARAAAPLPEVDLSWMGCAAPQPPLGTVSTLAGSSSSADQNSGARHSFEAVAAAQQQQQEGRQRLLDLGYSKMEVALALDESSGDVGGALQLLQQSTRPAVLPPAPTPAAVVRKNCILCAADSTRVEGLTCLAEDSHFVCNTCFTNFAEEQSKEGTIDLRCPTAPGCKSRPWPYAKIAQHLPDSVFGDLVSCRERQCEEAYKKREGRLRAEASRYAAPSYWSDAPPVTRRWKVVPVGRAEWAALANVVALPPGNNLGGRDQRLAGSYSSFRLGQAWRIENRGVFAKYAAERQRLKSVIAACKAQGKRAPRAMVREVFWKALGNMTTGLESDVNELYLTHGTKPDVVLSVISGGLNERYSGGIFGHGTYFAEDLGKNDQYVTEDTKYGDHRDLHKELYGQVRHPGKVYYAFLCRVAFGHFCVTKDARTDASGASIWSSAQRELAYIPGVSPPEPFHGLLGETGGSIQRYREFITFHGDRIYPEYLLAYHRC